MKKILLSCLGLLFLSLLGCGNPPEVIEEIAQNDPSSLPLEMKVDKFLQQLGETSFSQCDMDLSDQKIFDSYAIIPYTQEHQYVMHAWIGRYGLTAKNNIQNCGAGSFPMIVQDMGESVEPVAIFYTDDIPDDVRKLLHQIPTEYALYDEAQAYYQTSSSEKWDHSLICDLGICDVVWYEQLIKAPYATTFYTSTLPTEAENDNRWKFELKSDGTYYQMDKSCPEEWCEQIGIWSAEKPYTVNYGFDETTDSIFRFEIETAKEDDLEIIHLYT